MAEIPTRGEELLLTKEPVLIEAVVPPTDMFGKTWRAHWNDSGVAEADPLHDTVDRVNQVLTSKNAVAHEGKGGQAVMNSPPLAAVPRARSPPRRDPSDTPMTCCSIWPMSPLWTSLLQEREKNMPCNQAVSIAKTAITQPQLLALLTPQHVQSVVLTYLRNQYASRQPEQHYRTTETSVIFQLDQGDILLTIENGQVTVDAPRYHRQFSQQLATDIEQVLKRLADTLFQQSIQQALGTAVTQVQQVTVNNEDTLQPAVVFSVEL